jgi:hypothetical protein
MFFSGRFFLKEFGDLKYRASRMLGGRVAAGRLERETGWGVYQY